MRNGLKIIDADAHVLEPGDLFELASSRKGPVTVPLTVPTLLKGRLFDIGFNFKDGFTADLLLTAMDTEGIDASVLYPSLGLWAPFQPEIEEKDSVILCRRYNDWIAGFIKRDPSRLFASGLVPLINPTAAVKEIEHILELGLVAVMMRPNKLYGRNPGDKAYFELFELCEKHFLPIAIHEGLGLRSPTVGADRFDDFFSKHMCSHPMEQMCALTSLYFNGIFDRFPLIKIAFLESGIGWLPYWLHRLQSHKLLMQDNETQNIKKDPFEVLRENIYISCDPDEELLEFVIGKLGAQKIVLGSDFPHPDCLFPEAIERFFKEARGVLPEDLSKILDKNPRKLYNLENVGAASKTPKLTGGSEISFDETDIKLTRYPFLSKKYFEELKKVYQKIGINRLIKNQAVSKFIVDGQLEFAVATSILGIVLLDNMPGVLGAEVTISKNVLRGIFIEKDEAIAIAAYENHEIAVKGDLFVLLSIEQMAIDDNYAFSRLMRRCAL
jgi:predicted TIM-barrel fold metal-dependent hydrolase